MRKTGKALKSTLNAQAKGQALTVAQQSTLRKLPSWEMLIDEIKAVVEWYNARSHSELPKRADGQHYSPAEFRCWKLGNDGTELEWLTQFELRDLFMPQTEHTVRRCEIRFLNNIYYAAKLADEHDRKVLVRVTTFTIPARLSCAAWTVLTCVQPCGTAINSWSSR